MLLLQLVHLNLDLEMELLDMGLELKTQNMKLVHEGHNKHILLDQLALLLVMDARSRCRSWTGSR